MSLTLLPLSEGHILADQHMSKNAVVWCMKRFYIALFVILLLFHNVGTSQTKADASGKSDPPAPVAEEQNATDKSLKLHQEQTSIEDEAVVGDQSSSLVERVKQLATKTNWALFLSALATLFTGLSWLVSRNAVSVEKNAMKADLQPYISFPQTFDFDVKTPERGNTSFELVAYTDAAQIDNTGKTPASSITISAQGKFYAGERIHCDEQASISGLKNGDMVAGDTWYFGLRFEFPFPNGDAFHFKRIREMDIYITCTFTDMFSAGKTRKYIAHYLCSEMGFGADLESIKETK